MMYIRVKIYTFPHLSALQDEDIFILVLLLLPLTRVNM